MVYVDSRNLGYKPYIWTWLNKRPKQAEVDILKGLFDKYVEVSHRQRMGETRLIRT